MTAIERLQKLADEISIAREEALANFIYSVSGKSIQKTTDYYSGYYDSLVMISKMANSALIAEYLKK